MRYRLLLAALPFFLFACSTEDEPQDPTTSKENARVIDGTDDSGDDLCTENGWYDDGVCDPFCPQNDADCPAGEDPCETMGWYGDGVCDAYCPTADIDCGASAECGGELDVVCPEGQYCATPPGSVCGASGTCTDRPVLCIELDAPVCGCDGNTYDNACLAQSEGVNVDTAGACGADTNCGGIAGIQCQAQGDVCIYADGTCDVVDNMGACFAVTGECTAEHSPVCGCDGNTYSNRCVANNAGVSVDHEGDCAAAGQCGNTAGECSGGDLCIYPDGTCNIEDPIGTCMTPSLGCDEIYSPVCGCDGTTYSNRCFAFDAGVSIDHIGECGSTVESCGGIAGLVCETVTDACIFPDGTCDVMDNMGVCTPTAEVDCTTEYDPVCGCDGNTYGNRCEANTQGISIDRAGPCGEQCGGFAGLQCSNEDALCLYPDAMCSGADLMGICYVPVEPCPEIAAPVCGCDGTTYDNRCLASNAGISVDHQGTCEEPCGGIAGFMCENDSDFCIFPDGMCDVVDNMGVCYTPLQFCPDVIVPVCGCNGRTYDNRCLASSGGMSVEHEGECQ